MSKEQLREQLNELRRQEKETTDWDKLRELNQKCFIIEQQLEEVLNEIRYEKPIDGISAYSGEPVTIIGEQEVERANGEIVERYLYHIKTYQPKNGKPFSALKGNIIVQ